MCSIRCLAKFEFWLFVLNTALYSLNLAKKFLPVCLTYALLQSGQVSLYKPDFVHLSALFIGCLLCISICWMELLVRSAIFRSVCLNKLVMKVVCLPTYVNVAHFCVVVVVSLLGW